jgi:hypothetical protein
VSSNHVFRPADVVAGRMGENEQFEASNAEVCEPVRNLGLRRSLIDQDCSLRDLD